MPTVFNPSSVVLLLVSSLMVQVVPLFELLCQSGVTPVLEVIVSRQKVPDLSFFFKKFTLSVYLDF